MPLLGTFDVPLIGRRDDHGKRYAPFFRWLDGMIRTHRPGALAFEMPIPTRVSFVELRSDQHTDRLLTGFTIIAELVAALNKVPRCIEVPLRTAKLVLAGDQYASKGRMIAAAIALGYPVADDNQADACGIGRAAYDHMGLL